MAYYGYIRVSTETQAEKGGGLEVQRQAIEKYAADNNIIVVEIFSDAGISGTTKSRPALDRLLLETITEGDTIIVHNTSRLWRDIFAQAAIMELVMNAKARIHSIDDPDFDVYKYMTDPENFMVKGIMEMLAQWERLTIARKLARGRTTKAMNGDKPAGMCPFGYQYTEDKKHVVINPEEGKVVKLMFTEAQKGRSLQQIADTLNAKGYKSRRGNDWVRGSVGAILNNRFYIGELTHQGETIQGTHEPLISKIQFGKVSASLTRRHR